jgi:hypothetical protein
LGLSFYNCQFNYWRFNLYKGKQRMTEEQVPFGGNMKVPSDDCEEAFFALYPDFFYDGSNALRLWTQAWQAALDHVEYKKPVIQLI